MTYSPELDHLAARWADSPEGTAFAALADGLRKRGALAEAEAIAIVGLTRHPELIPGLIALARVREAQGDLDGAESALQKALAADPSHPVVLEGLEALALASGHPEAARAWSTVAEAAAASSGEQSAELGPVDAAQDQDQDQTTGEEEEQAWLDDAVWSEEDEARLEAPDAPELVTETLANLYQAQGHTGRAADAFRALAERHPDQAEFASRAAELDAEVVARRPRPYAAAQSGGAALGDWLAQVAAAAPPLPPREEGFDAFYEAPLPAARDTADFAAFQDWLKGLGR